MQSIRFFYFVFVVIFSGLATPFYHADPRGIVFLLGLGILLFADKLTTVHKSLLIALGLWFFYFIVNYITTNHFNRFFLIETPIKIIVAWIIIKHYGDKIFEKYEKVLFVLTLFSLFFYAWHIIEFESLRNFMAATDIGGRYGQNIVVYYLQEKASSTVFPRNAGFTWEPGPFSGFLLLAIFINLARNNFRLKNNFRLWVFTLALLTTQSTTGLMGLLVIVFWYAYNKYKIRYVMIWGPLVISGIIYLFTSVTFLKEKIEIERQEDYTSYLHREGIALGRFESFRVQMIDFINYPVAGTGGSLFKVGYFEAQGIQIGRVNGLGRLIATYGSIGLFFFLFLIIKTGIIARDYFMYKGWWVFPVLILFIGFGFSIIETPMFFVFYFLSVFYYTHQPPSVENNRAIRTKTN